MKRSSLISIVVLFFLTGKCYTQVSNNSPYSIYGIGDIGSRAGVLNRSMGGLGSVLIEPRHFNSANPASYAFTAEPTGDIGIYYSSLQLYNGKEEQYRQDVGLQNFGLGIPFSKKWGIGVGMVPYSKVGYQVSNIENSPEIGDITYKYNGEGGVNQVFIGLAYQIVDNDSLSFSIGANGSYLFGSVYNYSRSIFPSSSGYLNTRIKNTSVVSDFMFDFGTAFRARLTANSEIIIGGVANIPQKVKITKSKLVESILGQGDNERPVTIILAKDGVKGTVTIPQSIGGGVGYRYKKKFFAGAEYKMQNWSDYSESFGEPFDNTLLKNSAELSIGLAYNGMEGVVQENKFWKHMDYRIGARVEDTYLQLKDEQLREYGMSFGIGIPLFKSKSKSSINIGCELGERGSTNNGLIRERWVNGMIGFSIAPGYGDKWFYKRKYD